MSCLPAHATYLCGRSPPPFKNIPSFRFFHLIRRYKGIGRVLIFFEREKKEKRRMEVSFEFLITSRLSIRLARL